jgi:hypothetical protein
MKISHSERLEWIDVGGSDAESGTVFPILPMPVAAVITDTVAVDSLNLTKYFRPSSWTLGLLTLFNIVRIKRAVLEWVPRCGSSDRGNITVSHLRDITDITGTTGNYSSSQVVWTSGRWSTSILEATGRQSTSFPIWMNKRFELPLSGLSSFFSPVLEVGTVTSNALTVATGARTSFPDGCWMVGVEGLSQVASATSSTKLGDYGHFKITYTYEVSEPIPPSASQTPPSPSLREKGVQVDAVCVNVLDRRHTLILSQESECSEIRVDRSSLDPLYSPFKRAVYVGDTLRVGLDLSRAGSDQGVLLFEGCDGISFKGISRRAFSNEDAWEVSESPGEASAFFVSLQEGHTFGSVTYYPLD